MCFHVPDKVVFIWNYPNSLFADLADRIVIFSTENSKLFLLHYNISGSSYIRIYVVCSNINIQHKCTDWQPLYTVGQINEHTPAACLLQVVNVLTSCTGPFLPLVEGTKYINLTKNTNKANNSPSFDTTARQTQVLVTDLTVQWLNTARSFYPFKVSIRTELQEGTVWQNFVQ